MNLNFYKKLSQLKFKIKKFFSFKKKVSSTPTDALIINGGLGISEALNSAGTTGEIIINGNHKSYGNHKSCGNHKSQEFQTEKDMLELYYIYSEQEVVHFYNYLEEAYNKAVEWADNEDDDFFHIGKVRECEFYISNGDKTLISFEKVQKLF